MYIYDTLTAAVADLDKRGYEYDFELEPEFIECKAIDLRLMPEEFEIDEFYRFEGLNDPDDSAVIYAISSQVGNLKGVIIDAYGAYAENLAPDLLDKLKMHK
ncbi:phosphoribosylpyrophosphate synthetase [Pedobacter sp. MC2016-24]|uniref:phosphoribosylpyrophosphate synthetase n=1 Tax=Pedobacter sp. MC2016-24 TaxID=2780090 RepID=UPI00187FCE72|nr:phosphoribosylpyrophosphate synthetase [Pedobacter sp. MC2016-24]MBE9597707.1 phosphoribosylpyrophosphate synthetase [Pedobacter sp. MC2016-24]